MRLRQEKSEFKGQPGQHSLIQSYILRPLGNDGRQTDRKEKKKLLEVLVISSHKQKYLRVDIRG